MLFDELRNIPEDKRDAFLHYWMIMETREKRIPHKMTMELLHACTLKCPMCYNKYGVSHLKKELSKDEWIRIAEDAFELGVRSVTLTGGECMLYPGFVELYRALYEMNFDIFLITNATVVTPEIISLFQELPPKMVYITIYGMSPETYEKACGNRNAFVKVIKNTEEMLAKGIAVSIQTTVTKLNMEDIPELLTFCKDRGMTLRVSSELIAEDIHAIPDYYLSFDENERFKQMLSAVVDKERILPALATEPTTVHENGMGCSAGRNAFCVDCEGNLQPCPAFKADIGNVRENSLAELWHKLIEWADGVPQLVECQRCIFRHRCKSCTLIHYADMKQYGIPSPRLCWKRNHPDEAAEIEASLNKTSYTSF